MFGSHGAIIRVDYRIGKEQKSGVIQNLLANWKTTSTGIILIIGGIIHLVFFIVNHIGSWTSADEAIITATITGMFGGIGLLVAGDASKSAADVQKVSDKVDQNTSALITGDTSLLAKPIPPLTPTEPEPTVKP